MNSVRIGDLRRGHDMRDVEVRIKTSRLSDAYRLVGEFDMQAFLIRRRVDRYGLDAHLSTGTNDPEGNFSSVGNQYLFKHSDIFEINQAGSTKNKGWSYSTGEASSTSTFIILPFTSLSISLKSFMASMIQTTLPRSISSPTLMKDGLSGEGLR